MSAVGFSASSLKEGRWYEYLVRFALGGAATVFTGLIISRYGASIGGLFLALPAIFCASATLIEKHEVRRKREAGMDGRRRGEEAAALDAAGAVLGSLGMLGVRDHLFDDGETQRSGGVHLRVVWLADRVDRGMVCSPKNEISTKNRRLRAGIDITLIGTSRRNFSRSPPSYGRIVTLFAED